MFNRTTRPLCRECWQDIDVKIVVKIVFNAVVTIIFNIGISVNIGINVNIAKIVNIVTIVINAKIASASASVLSIFDIFPIKP